MSGLAGQAIGLDVQSPTPIGGPAAVDAESNGSMENFIGFGLGATSYDPSPVDFDAADDTVTSAADGTTRVAPEYTDNQLTWGGAGPAFNPVDLFADGENGFIYDLTVAEIFQLSDGTVPATANADPIGYLEDTSGHGYNALQSTAGSRPQLLVDAGLRKAIRSTGAFNLSAANVDFSGSTVVTTVCSFELEIADINQQSVFSSGDNPFSTGGFAADVNQNEVYSVGSVFGQGTGNYRFEHSGDVLEFGVPVVVAMQINPMGVTDADKLRIWIDSVEVSVSTWLTSGTLDLTTFADRVLTLMSRGGAGFFLGNVFFAMAVGRALTDKERNDAIAYAAKAAEVIPSYAIKSYGLSRHARLTPSYAEGSAFSISEWTTDATSVDVDFVSTIFSAYAGFASVAVYVNDVFYSSTSCGAASGTLTISLPAGSKKVGILNGAQSKPVNVVLGTWITSATFNAPATKLADMTGGMVAYGDSITIGQDASPVGQNAWSLLVRAALPNHKLSHEAWGVRSLFDDASTAEKIKKFVARIVEFSPTSIWLAIGTNDYGLNKWSAAAFGTAYGQVLDALHTALPAVTIYAQTPIVRADETANGSGSTLEDYRTQIASAAASRSAYTTFVDGKAFMTTASLVDGVHPTTAGHLLYANAVKTILGV